MQTVIISGFLAMLLCVSSMADATDDGTKAGGVEQEQQAKEQPKSAAKSQQGTAVQARASKPVARTVYQVATFTALGGVIFLVVFGAALMLISLVRPFGLRRNWGGFGGEMAGWEFSSGFARLLAGFVMLSIGSTLGWQIMKATEPESQHVTAERSESGSTKNSPESPGAAPRE